MTCSEENNSNQTNSYNPQEAYNYLKQKNASFSLSITAGGEKIISFGNADGQFPEGNPFTFKEAGTVALSIGGTIGENEVSQSFSLTVKEQEIQFSDVDVSGIAYNGGAKVGDELDLSNIEITLKMKRLDKDGSSEVTDTYNPNETYAFLKKQKMSFSLSIAVGEEQVISFGNSDGQFPEGVPYPFKEVGTIAISVSGSIAGRDVSASFLLEVEVKKRAENDEALLKMILGETEYNTIKGNLESNLGEDGLSQHLVLTAELIKAVGENYPANMTPPVIMTTDEYDETVKKYAAGFVAQHLGIITVTKERDDYPEKTYYKITFAEKTSLKVGAETFDLGEIKIVNNDKIDFTDATFTGKGIKFSEINQARGPFTPTLDCEVVFG